LLIKKLLVLGMLLPVVAGAQEVPTEQGEPPPISLPRPLDILVQDTPNDNGRALDISWELPSVRGVRQVEVLRRRVEDGVPGDEEVVGAFAATVTDYRDSNLEGGSSYLYGVRLLGGTGPGPVLWSETAVGPRPQWFHARKLYLLIILIFISAAIIISLMAASRGGGIFIRKIAGLEAVEEAVGRATEMGKSCLFIAGIQDLDNVQTMAGITILGSIARMTAKYEAGLYVPTSRSLVMSTARETIKEAYTLEGRPDLYSNELSDYISDEQFGFVASVDGYMLREKPSACFYMGAFFAESLILAETGNSIGAIQIAGTAQPTQLPFFVAACDYTLIGEELFAASAYLSQDPRILGSLRGQDIGKVLAMIVILGGVVFETLGQLSSGDGLLGAARFLREFFATSF
jgi:hypothetical protein